ncbi:MAG: hypothetical protein AB7F86_19115 [Bdellovibrionales bacterium]
MNLTSIGYGQSVSISGNVILPSDHKLNKGAPSAVDVYEKQKGGWEKVKTIDLKSIFHLGNKIPFQQKVILQSNKSQLAVDATLYHCDQAGKNCVIESFQGVAERNPRLTSTEIKVQMAGHQP